MSDCGKESKKNERLMKGVEVPVRACKVGMAGGIGSDNVVICENVFEAKGFRRLGILSDGPGVGT